MPAPAGEVVATFTEYQEAVSFVEKLIEKEFPVGAIAIVGNGLRTVERVRGRLDYSKAAISGASMGAWIGLFAALFADTSGDVKVFAFYLLTFAGIGILVNIIRFALTRNKRGFISASMIVAGEYQVQVPSNLVAQANQISGL